MKVSGIRVYVQFIRKLVVLRNLLGRILIKRVIKRRELRKGEELESVWVWKWEI